MLRCLCFSLSSSVEHLGGAAGPGSRGVRLLASAVCERGGASTGGRVCLPADATICHFSTKIGEQEIVAELQDRQSVSPDARGCIFL